MSCTQTYPGTGRHSHRSSVIPVGAEGRLRDTVLRLVARKLYLWIARGEQRHDLARLDEHLLNDIGVTPSEAAREAAKPFWRA